MTSTLPLEILDLRHYSAPQLRPILDQESRVWNQRLHWDFRASAELLLQYLDSHILPGYVALENGEISGYVFCVYEESKAVIGDVFATSGASETAEPASATSHLRAFPACPTLSPLPAAGMGSTRTPNPAILDSANPCGQPTAVGIENQLLEFLIELLQNSPGVDRIESQLLLHPYGRHVAIFDRCNFSTHRRLFMEFDLTPPPTLRATSSRLPPGLELRRWNQNDFNAAGRLIAAAYDRHLDARINDQYRTVAGSLRFLHNIVRFPGCGIFDPAASFVITAPGEEEMAGLLLCSRVREDIGHVTQICVATTHRGQGLATHMLQACATEMTSRSVKALTLTVTEANAGAVSLYRNIGFQEKHAFAAMVWQRDREPG